VAAACAAWVALARWRRSGEATGVAAKLAFSASVLLLLASAAALGAEVWFRFLHDATDSFGITKTTQRWFDRHYRENSWRVRDDVEYAIRKSDGRRRVTFLGDSFTAGQGVEDVTDRFANLVRAAHPEWEVHVLARNGLDSAMELRFFEQALARGYQTDDVVLVYCLNDIAELVPEWQATVQRIYRASAALSVLVEHSFAANQLYFRLFRARDPEVADYFGLLSSAYQGPVWREQARVLTRLARITRRAGIRLLVVTFPFLHALGDAYPYAAAHERLDRLWRSLDVPHLDLLSVYGATSPDELVVSAVDAHPNERAHALAARAIERFLADGACRSAVGTVHCGTEGNER
jgi:lysophospholipase L1-like esterase